MASPQLSVQLRIDSGLATRNSCNPGSAHPVSSRIQGTRQRTAFRSASSRSHGFETVLSQSFGTAAAAAAAAGGVVRQSRRERGSWARSAEVDVQKSVEDDPEALQDLQDVEAIIETMEILKKKRQMTVSECRLTLMIEDPREEEKRRQLGVENESGCSREEIAAAYTEVMEDRVPADRMALRKLAQEMRDWPRLRDADSDDEGGPKQKKSLYAQITDVGIRVTGRNRAPPPPAAAAAADWDSAADQAIAAAAAAKDKQKDLGDILPNWVGYSVLYGVSFVPIIIGVVVVIILFLNSLQ